MKYSIIINCYNTLPLMKQSIDAAVKTTSEQTEIILVNNHPPYQDVQNYLKRIHHPRVRTVDPGCNLGCTIGFQYGAMRARGEYLVKLDDDTIVPSGQNWIKAMSQALKDFSELAYVGLVVPIYRLGRFPRVVRPLYTLEFYDDLVHFACIMINRTLWRTHFIINDQSLYGGDESFYAQKAAQLGMKKGYLVSHQCIHLARTIGSDPLYGAWKIFYLNGNHLDFTKWRQTFTLGPAELTVLKQFQYPADQIMILETLCPPR